MDLTKLSNGDKVVAGSGIALFIFSFFPWYGVDGFSDGRSGWDYFFTGVHWSYFLVPHIVAVRTWQKHPAFFKRYLVAMTLSLAMGLAIYFLIPSNPPWLAPEVGESPMFPVPNRVMAQVGEQIGGGIYRASYKVIGESNPIAAMPSLHMAITFLVVFPAIRAGKKWAIVAFALGSA